MNGILCMISAGRQCLPFHLHVYTNNRIIDDADGFTAEQASDMFRWKGYVCIMIYGYARVSSMDQNEERQIIALTANGVDRSAIYIDKKSGCNFERPQYRRLVRRLKEGDVVFILSIDRLGRNYEEIQTQWRYITKQKKADIVVIDMPLLDTRKEKNLIGTFLSDVVLQLLSFVAENERNNIRERQAEGIAAARARGVKFGRPARSLPEDFDRYAQLVREGKMSLRGAARACGMAPSSFSYSLNKKTACSESVLI